MPAARPRVDTGVAAAAEKKAIPPLPDGGAKKKAIPALPGGKTDTSATRSKTRGALLSGLRNGNLEKAVANIEAQSK